VESFLVGVEKEEDLLGEDNRYGGRED